MNNMQTFYQWLFKNTGKQDIYRNQLVNLSRTKLSKITSLSGFWTWEFWGSPGGPETK